jgi:LVIVD repeat
MRRFCITSLFALAVGCGASGCGSSDDTPTDPGSGGAGVGGGAGGSVPTGPYQDNLVMLGRMEGSTFVEILEVRARDDGWVLFCSGVRGLNVVDAREPSLISKQWQLASSEGSFQFPRCQHVAWAGDAIYMSNRGDEIQPTPFVTAFTSTDLASDQPTEGPSFTQAGLSFEGLAAAGDLLFAAVHEDGVVVLQNTGASLDLIGTVSGLTNAWGVALQDDLLYVADGPGGLAIVDVADPSAPVLLGSVALDGPAQFVELEPDAGLAYVAAGSAGMIVVDVSNPTAPSVVSRSDTPGTTLQISLSGGHAFVTDWNDVRVFDVADPAAPTLVATERIPVQDFPRVLGAAALPSADGHSVFMGEWTGLYSYAFTPGIVAPDLRLHSEIIDLGPAEVGELKAAAVIVENEGGAPLIIHQVVTDGLGMSVASTLPIELDPGQKAAIEIRVENASTMQLSGLGVLLTNDPDEAEAPVTLVTNTPGLGIGDAAPDVDVNLVGGGQWSLASQLGNVVVLSYFATF